MSQIPSDELATAHKDLSPKAYVLLMYYYSKGTTWEWIDKNMAKDLSMSTRTLKLYRNELITKDYLFIVKGEINNVFIGRQAVMDWKHPHESLEYDNNPKYQPM